MQQQQQQQQQEEDGHLAMEGYTADKSSASTKCATSSDNDDSFPVGRKDDEDKLGLVIAILQPQGQRQLSTSSGSSSTSSRSDSVSCPISHMLLSTIDRKRSGGRRKRKRSKYCHRHVRKQRRTADDTSSFFLSQKSPIHPDIDISLTQHIAVSDDLISATTDAVLQGAAVYNNNSSSSTSAGIGGAATTAKTSSFSTVEIASAVPALSKAVLQYFADLRQEFMTATRKEIVSTHTSAQSSASTSHRRRPDKSPENRDRSLLQKDATVPKMAQIVSDVATFSEEPHRLEDALDLTDTPRYV